MQAAAAIEAPCPRVFSTAVVDPIVDAESDLIEQARQDPAAFGILYDRYLERIFRFIYSRVNDRAVAEDLTEDVFFKALRNIGSYRDRGVGLRPWLYRIALNAISDHYRRGERAFALEAFEGDTRSADDVLDIFIERDRVRQVWQAVDRLPASQRQAMVLRFSDDLSTRQVAQTMGKSAEAVKLLVYRAVQRLRHEFALQEA